MNKYVIAKYIRLSVDDGITESLSIPSQRRILDEFIDNLDITNIEVIEMVDNGYTGLNMERPAVQELIELVRSGGVNCICVKDFSRFSRDAMDSGYFIEQVFPLYGVRFICVSEPFDSDNYKNDTGGIDIAFKFLMHEYYSKDLSLKVKSALRVKQLNGESVTGNPPYGYKSDGKKKIEPDPETAEIVRLIFKLALDGCVPSAIRDTLFQKGVPTPMEAAKLRRGHEITPKCRWGTQAIVKILIKEQYTGTYISGKYERKTVGGNNTVLTDKSQWIVIPDNHPALVSRKDFDRIQVIMEQYLKSNGKSNAAFLPENAAVVVSKRNRKANYGLFPLYGYLSDENRNPVINPEPAEIIRQIFQMALDGKTIPQICETLTKTGYPTPGEQNALDCGKNVAIGKAWRRGAVIGILRNIQYTGVAVSGKSHMAYIEVDGVRQDKGFWMPMPESEWHIEANRRPPIISEKTYNAVQQILNDKSNAINAKTVREFLLKGKARCGCCGGSLGYDDGGGYPLFRCDYTEADPGADCHKFKTVVKEIDDAVITVIRKQAEVILNVSNLGEISLKGDMERRLSDYEKRISEYTEQRQGHYERFIQQEIDRAEYLKLKDECSAGIDKLNKLVAALRAEVKLKKANQATLTLASRTVSGAIPHKELVDVLIDKVLIFPNKRIEIDWKIKDFAAV